MITAFVIHNNDPWKEQTKKVIQLIDEDIYNIEDLKKTVKNNIDTLGNNETDIDKLIINESLDFRKFLCFVP